MSSLKSIIFSPPLIVDMGSCFTKAGFAGDSEPLLYFPTVVGYPEYPVGDKDYLIGGKAIENYDISKLVFPIRYGMVYDFGGWETIIKYIIEELRIQPERQTIVYIYRFLQPRDTIIRVAEELFEEYNFHGLSFLPSELLSAYSAGLRKALVIDSGDHITQIVPISYPKSLIYSLRRMNIGGDNITKYLAKLLARKGFYADPENIRMMEKMREIKEEYCYFSDDFRSELKDARKNPLKYSTRILLNGTTIELTEEKFWAPEIMYRPMFVGLESKPLHELIIDSIFSIDLEEREAFYRNIILTGGNTLLRNFCKRLYRELKEIAPKKPAEYINVRVHPAPKYSAFLGASIMASFPEFKDLVITKEQWEVVGTESVVRTLSFFQHQQDKYD